MFPEWQFQTKPLKVEGLVEKEVSLQAILIRDGFLYLTISATYVVEQKMQKIPASKADTILPWVHTMIARSRGLYWESITL